MIDAAAFLIAIVVMHIATVFVVRDIRWRLEYIFGYNASYVISDAIAATIHILLLLVTFKVILGAI